MKKQLLLILMTLLLMVTSADAVEIDGIYYILDKSVKTAGVTNCQEGQVTDILMAEGRCLMDE